MKAEELRIGNYVFSAEDNKTGEVFQIDSSGIIFVNKNGNRWQDLKNIQPIPLTEEILLRCRFKNYENECSWIKQGIKIFEDENGHYIFFDHDIHLNSLHQLQNLYFALTGIELTIEL